jgi:hypothetical protein
MGSEYILLQEHLHGNELTDQVGWERFFAQVPQKALEGSLDFRLRPMKADAVAQSVLAFEGLFGRRAAPHVKITEEGPIMRVAVVIIFST